MKKISSYFRENKMYVVHGGHRMRAQRISGMAVEAKRL